VGRLLPIRSRNGYASFVGPEREQLFGRMLHRRGKPDLVLHFGVVDGRPECVGIEVGALTQPEDIETYSSEERRHWRLRPGRVLDGPLRPISAEQLRGLGLGVEVRETLRQWSGEVRHLGFGDFEMPSGEAVPRRWRLEARQRLLLTQPEPRPGRPRRYDRQHFEQVARVYLEGEALNRTPTRHVARSFGVSQSTAAKWVQRCRYDPEFAGLLPPTTRGRPTKGTTKARRKLAGRRK
jgi:hypothetical protein